MTLVLLVDDGMLTGSDIFFFHGWVCATTGQNFRVGGVVVVPPSLITSYTSRSCTPIKTKTFNESSFRQQLLCICAGELDGLIFDKLYVCIYMYLNKWVSKVRLEFCL